MKPFIRKIGKRVFVRLNKALYRKDLIVKAKEDNPDGIINIKTEKNYHLVELDAVESTDYLDFLNYLMIV